MMSDAASTMPATPTASGERRAQVQTQLDRRAVALLLGALALLYGPSFWQLASGRWADQTQGHELLIVMVVAWLFYRRRDAVLRLPDRASPWLWAPLLAAGLAMNLLGHLLASARLQMLSLVLVVAALLASLRGAAALREAWFPLFFLLFAVPPPYELTLALTGPLKQAVSAVATSLLEGFGFPVGRSGVVITIGQYQLLVVEACAGLQTMFTLEAMGLLYASLVQHPSLARKALLALLVVPISFLANVTRVMVLALITFWFGDAAGQGFLHGFAGIVLFAVALALIMAIDTVLGRVMDRRRPRAQ